MNIIRIDKNNQVNGSGLRCVIWVAGCDHNCPFCHNPETWDYNYGHPLTSEDAALIYDQLNKEEIDGITITGGDPLSMRNRDTVGEFCKILKHLYPNKTIWVYTGCKYEELPKYILSSIDVLVDGPYVNDLNPGVGKLKWRGSSNQRIIDVQKSLKTDRVELALGFNGLPY